VEWLVQHSDTVQICSNKANNDLLEKFTFSTGAFFTISLQRPIENLFNFKRKISS